MEAIFHEKQEGSLCAQHCLNGLLQGPYFTPVDLATLAQRMDDEERLRMSESGVDSEEYRKFLEQPSGNYDDSGYFSVQVISSALQVWGLELVPYNSTEPRALQAQNNPLEMQAYICNYRDHWFTIRRLGYQWFNLNSLLTGPELISNTYLTMFLAQLQQEGYSIFVVFGTLPECEADSLLRVVPAVQTVKPRLISNVTKRPEGSTSELNEDQDLQKALRMSLGQSTPDSPDVIVYDEDEVQLKAALAQSLNDEPIPEVALVESQADDIELQKALRLSLASNNPTEPSTPIVTSSSETDEELQRALRLSLEAELDEENDEDSQLQRAMQLSLECCDSPIPDIEQLRRTRIAYLEASGSHTTDRISSTSAGREVNT